MILPVNKPRNPALRILALALALCCAILPAYAQKKPRQDEKPMAGPRATALRITWIYVSSDFSSQKLDRVQIGREMVMAEKSGPWMRVYANTDIVEVRPAAHLRLDRGQRRCR